MYFSEKPSTNEDAELTTGIHTLPLIWIFNEHTWPADARASSRPHPFFERKALGTRLNFRVRSQFEIKILIVPHINTTYFIWIFKKIKLEPAMIWKPVPCQRITSKKHGPRWVDTWARDTAKWYWSADTLFWQLSMDHNIDVYQFSCAPIPN